MGEIQQVTTQTQAQRLGTALQSPVKPSRTEVLLRKIVLAALTMVGIGYILVNTPIALLIGQSLSGISITSQANINALAGRILYLAGTVASSVLGALFIFGAVKFYEREETNGVVLLGILLGSFYLLCLGVGYTVAVSTTALPNLLLIVAPILVIMSAAAYTSSSTRIRYSGYLLGIAGGIVLAYATFSLRVMDLIFSWSIAFPGPFMSFTIVESAVVIVAPIATCVNSFFNDRFGEQPLVHLFSVLVAVLYGIGTFIGALVLSLGFWDMIWKSPWNGPLHGISEWTMSVVVFWSASLVLLDIGGVLLVASGCLGFAYVAQEFSQG